MSDVVIVSAKRTPQGRFLGALTSYSAVDLALHAAQATLQGIDPAAVEQVIIGQVVTAGTGWCAARQVAVKLGLPLATPGFGVNMACGSGLLAVGLAAQAIRGGEALAVLCGGTESMSNAPYLLERARGGYKLGDGQLVDALLRDTLIDSFHQEHMAVTAQRLADQMTITRAEQDAYAAMSQQRAGAAMQAGRLAPELAPMKELERDEHPRPDTTAAKLATLKPAFSPTGSITAGNASGLNDGAAVLLLADAAFARAQRWPVLARVAGWTTTGVDPRLMGVGPVHATRKLLARLQRSLSQFDAIEINEAFAAQTLACCRELKLDPQQINTDGGAIALGHPVGASGARLAAHLAHRIAQGHSKLALASLCIGGGQGIAMALEPA